ncbi:MAG: hypothetical protein OEZ06_16815 [Myxococcales bacterium]|nr:hypothetical protein [Myxococcales bacterium]
MVARGRLRQVAIMVCVAALVAGAGALLLQAMDEADRYSLAASQAKEIEREHFEGFFECALPGSRSSQRSAQQIRVAFQQLGNNLGKSYASTLRRCEPQLRALATTVEALPVPTAAQPQYAKLVTATTELSAANASYLQYLSDANADYDYVAALPLHKALGAASVGYIDAQRNLMQALE